jgi:hypothetical protein
MVNNQLTEKVEDLQKVSKAHRLIIFAARYLRASLTANLHFPSSSPTLTAPASSPEKGVKAAGTRSLHQPLHSVSRSMMCGALPPQRYVSFTGMTVHFVSDYGIQKHSCIKTQSRVSRRLAVVLQPTYTLP